MIEQSSIYPALARAKAAFRSNFGEPAAVEVLSDRRHNLFRFRSGEGEYFVVKIYRATSTLFKEMEIVAYDSLDGSPFIRRCFAAAAAENAKPAYIITEFVDGDTLLNRVEAGSLSLQDEYDAASKVVEFVRECAQVNVRGFGELDSKLNGEYTTWTGFLSQYLTRLKSLALSVADKKVRSVLLSGLATLDGFFVEQNEFFCERKAMFTPIDMNMANFLIDSSGRLIVLDLKSFIGADPLFAVGEWISHTYGTSRADAFREAFGPLEPNEENAVRFYALICNIDILLYVINNNTGDPRNANPWGNKRRFVDLIEEHRDHLS